jgi:glycosyltransferase involved in cell wall biosynthesis
VHNGVRNNKITVIKNFLPEAQIDKAIKRARFIDNGVRNVVVISRIDPIKRIDLLLDAIDLESALRNFNFKILGAGWDFEKLRDRAKTYSNVAFVGFTDQVAKELARSDLLLHCCPVESFGLAILEAMAAKAPYCYQMLVGQVH